MGSKQSTNADQRAAMVALAEVLRDIFLKHQAALEAAEEQREMLIQ